MTASRGAHTVPAFTSGDSAAQSNGVSSSSIIDTGGSNDWTVADMRFHEILKFYSKDARSPERQDACEVVKRLSPQEQDVAATCSYAFWYLSCKFRSRSKDGDNGDNSNNRRLPDEWRFGAAVREAIRHLEGVDSVEEAVKLLKGTLKFHMDKQTRQYRCCVQMLDGVTVNDIMIPTDDVPTDTNHATAEEMERRKARIHHEMTNVQPFVTRGHDRDLRSIIFAFPRNAAGDEEGFVDSILYTMERAVACVEFRSKGRQDKIVAVLDSQGSTSPSMKACKAAVNILQLHYPGRLKNLIILNPPYLLLGIYKMLKPFMDPDTAAKFIVVKGTKQTETEMAKLVDASQAMPMMIPSGELRSKVDVETYLYQRPFFCLYDDDGKEYNRPGDAELMASVGGPTDVTISSKHSTSDRKITATASHDPQRAKSKGSMPASTATTLESNNLVVVRSLAVGELVMANIGSNDGDDDDDLHPRVVMVQA
jgi:hypothetical protein